MSTNNRALTLDDEQTAGAPQASHYETMQLAKTDGSTFDNDAKACFDRNISSSACHMHADLLLKVSYVVKTQSYINEEALRVVISMLIIGLMPKKADRIQFQDPR